MDLCTSLWFLILFWFVIGCDHWQDQIFASALYFQTLLGNVHYIWIMSSFHSHTDIGSENFNFYISTYSFTFHQFTNSMKMVTGWCLSCLYFLCDFHFSIIFPPYRYFILVLKIYQYGRLAVKFHVHPLRIPLNFLQILYCFLIYLDFLPCVCVTLSTYKHLSDSRYPNSVF